jgi:hypothetical protein
LTRDQVGGFPCVVLALAIETHRVFEPDAVGYIKMKNGHLRSSCESMPASEACSRIQLGELAQNPTDSANAGSIERPTQ